MGLRRLPFQLIMLVAVLLAAAAAPKPKPDCDNSLRRRQDPISIPYESRLFPDKDFLIKCDNSPDPHKAFLRESNIHVTNISVDGRLHVNVPPARYCSPDHKGEDVSSLWLSSAKFTISNIQNRFTVIGCDSYAYIQGYIGEQTYRAGCMSFCDSFDNITRSNGSCIGTGCCQIEIPKGLTQINITAYRFSINRTVTSFNPCTYAFVVDQSKFNFSSTYFSDLPEDFSVMLDWAINGTCTEQPCGGNARCDKLDDDTSEYRCLCNQGYEGNPYLP